MACVGGALILSGVIAVNLRRHDSAATTPAIAGAS
jgi:hypothetical protein